MKMREIPAPYSIRIWPELSQSSSNPAATACSSNRENRCQSNQEMGDSRRAPGDPKGQHVRPGGRERKDRRDVERGAFVESADCDSKIRSFSRSILSWSLTCGTG